MGWQTDIRQAGRQVIRRPGYTLGVVGCLALGLASTVGTFSALTSLLDGDQPGIVDRSRLVRLELAYDVAPGAEAVGERRLTRQPWSTRDLRVLETSGLPPALTHLAAEGRRTVTVVGPGGATASTVAFVSDDYFQTLGTRAQRGRLLDATTREQNTAAIVVSDYFWRTSLGGRADVIGMPLDVAGRAFEVAGVTPPRFNGLSLIQPGESAAQGVHAWVALREVSSILGRVAPDDAWLRVRGRLADAATAEDAERQLSAAAAIVAAAPTTRAAATVSARSGVLVLAETTTEVVALIGMVLILPMTVLLIGCLNVANLQLARASERARELAVRLSLGATRGQLIRLLTLETAARAAIAVVVAVLPLQLLFAGLSRALPVALALDGRAVVLSLSLLLLVALITGLLPAWLALRRSALSPLKQAAQGGGAGHSRARAVLVGAQVAVSLVLLCMAGVMLRSFNGVLLAVPPTFTQQLVARFDLAQITGSPAGARELADTLVDRLTADARISAAALSRSSTVRYAEAAAERRSTTLIEITPSYLRVMDLTVLSGRTFTPADTEDVALVSARFASAISPAGSALGRVLTIDSGGRARRAQIVGVVSDIGTEPSTAPPAPVLYTPLGRDLDGEFMVRVKTTAIGPVSEEMRAIVRNLDPRMVWLSIQRGDEMYLEDASGFRYVGWAIGMCGAIALTLAATGLYALIAYAVQLRRREIGVRLAIGASPRDIVRLVTGQAARLTVAGAVVGLMLALPLNLGFRAVSLVPIAPLDPLAYAPATGVLLVVGLLASLGPARRAARVDPVRTLKDE
jgi:putative ABC transport system permease protein